MNILEIPITSFWEGFIHPILGVDHLLAMVSVGVISAIISQNAIWIIPASFVCAMALGGAIGLAGFGVLGAEFWIAVSLVVLSLAISFGEKKLSKNTDISTFVTMLFVASFGIAHGNAHGLEIPQTSDPMQFSIGFLIGTSALHVLGVGLGKISLMFALCATGLRITGLFAASYGVGLIVRYLGRL